QVAGSAQQDQSQRSVLVGGTGATVSNVVQWTVFPQTFVVTQVTDTDFLAQLDAAQAYTAGHAGEPALVRFDWDVFPGASTPQTIQVKNFVTPPNTNHCVADDVCPTDVCAVNGNGRHTTKCITASNVTVDGLDVDGAVGGVILDTGRCQRSLFRL